MASVIVVHLVSAAFGPDHVERFARAYRRHPAESEHELVVLLNGFDDRPSDAHLAPVQDLASRVLEVPRSPIDLNAYRHFAAQGERGLACFLNSAAEPLVGGWLGRLAETYRETGAGLVGCSGSWETLPRRWRSFRSPQFPNPHLRTNGFLLDLDDMRSLEWPYARDKNAAWRIENGARSLTRQLLASGREVLVVGRTGHYGPSEWAVSRTFRSGEQDNLLVADNRTREWASADPSTRRELTTRAWGEVTGHEGPDGRDEAK